MFALFPEKPDIRLLYREEGEDINFSLLFLRPYTLLRAQVVKADPKAETGAKTETGAKAKAGGQEKSVTQPVRRGLSGRGRGWRI